MKNSILDVSVKKIDGQAMTLETFRGNVLLIVNVASKCGLTPQYAQLEKLYQEKHALGFEILGFPANNFMGQEPGTDAEIASFCSTSYDVHFPLFSKISVKGADQHPLYGLLTKVRPDAVGEGPMRERLAGYGIKDEGEGAILWNFEKFLVARDGTIAERFAPDVSPQDARLTAAVERELAKAG